jgi:hypothetical protein
MKEITLTVLMGLIILGICIHLVLTLFGYLGVPIFQAYRSAVHAGGEAVTIGYPICAAASFAGVWLLMLVFPLDKTTSGALSLKFVGIEFTGPAGPVTLWLVGTIILAAGIKLLR